MEVENRYQSFLCLPQALITFMYMFVCLVLICDLRFAAMMDKMVAYAQYNPFKYDEEAYAEWAAHEAGYKKVLKFGGWFGGMRGGKFNALNWDNLARDFPQHFNMEKVFILVFFMTNIFALCARLHYGLFLCLYIIRSIYVLPRACHYLSLSLNIFALCARLHC